MYGIFTGWRYTAGSAPGYSFDICVLACKGPSFQGFSHYILGIDGVGGERFFDYENPEAIV